MRLETENQRTWETQREAQDEPSVLVVDDEPEIRRLVARLIRRSFPSCDVQCAADVPEAKEKLLDFRPSLVIADLRMPGGSGLEICRLIQEHPWLSKTRVLVITGYATPQAREKAFARGSCEFLPKPFSLDELIGSVARLIA